MSNKKQWELKKETEIRCELNENDWLTLKLVAGTAEIFGIEMAANKEYNFKDCNVAVFTWYGCTLESSGNDDGLYIADSTPMIAYVNTHVQLEARRDVALANKDYGPRVILVGPTDHGKSSTAQILSSYAVRLDRAPLYVDLDVGQGSFGVPGCLSAIPLDKSSLSVEDGITSTTPLVYFHGYNSPKENIDLYKTMITNLAEKVKERLNRDLDAKSSGVIVNTCGWIDQEGFDLLLHCIDAFNIDVILVMNHDKLYSNLRTALAQKGATDGGVVTSGSSKNKNNNNNSGGVVVVKLPRSGGVVTRDSTTRKRLRKVRTREYFYGKLLPTGTTIFSPIRKESVSISSFTFLKVGGVQLSEGMRVVGETKQQDTWKVSKIIPTTDLAYSVVAVLHPLDDSEINSNNNEVSQNLVLSNVAGFVSIVQVDTEKDSMTLLCPCPGSLPSNLLLVGGIKWME